MDDLPSRLAARGRSPLMENLGVAVSLEDGHPVIRLRVDERHLRSHNIAHGGFLCTVLDTALGAAAYETLGDDASVELVTAQLNVNFLRPAWNGEEIVARGEVVHAGRQTMVITGRIETAAGQPVVTGSGTFMRVEIPPQPSADE